MRCTYGRSMVPVMSNSGSGNQGICATNPVVVFAKENGNTPDELVRALTLSHLTAIYIKQNLGTLSALCGCIVACTGSSCGITYLMGGDYNNICYSIKNMIANLRVWFAMVQSQLCFKSIVWCIYCGTFCNAFYV